MNVSQAYGAISRLFIVLATGVLPTSKAQILRDIAAVREMLAVVSKVAEKATDEDGQS